MGGSSSTQNRESYSILDSFSDIFKSESTAEPTTRKDNLQGQYHESINSSSLYTLRPIRRIRPHSYEGRANSSIFSPVRENYDDSRKFRIGELPLNDENLRDQVLTYDINYFPNALEVILINPVNIHDNSPFNISLGETYKCFPIHEYSIEYSKIKNMITNKYIKIKKIDEIYNPFLKRSYQLKKNQKEEQFSLLHEMLLFHGTKMENIDNICKNNLKWSLCGTGTGHRFGQGVSFSCNAMYAAAYSHDASEKVMILFNVLVGKTCVGTKDMKLPPDGCDTTLKNAIDHIVVVKYEDNEFYPAYKIKFHIAPGYTPKRNKNINHSRRGRVQHNSFSFDFDDLDFYFD